MFKISHRGNITGKNPMENSPELILNAIKQGFNVEIDIRRIESNWYLGHDFPQYSVGDLFIEQNKKFAWFHCKNLEALESLDKNSHMFFWHQDDDFTLTSTGHIWTYPGKNITSKSIIVDLNMTQQYDNVAGICTDYPNLIE